MSSQTDSCIDVPYSMFDPFTNFWVQVCIKSKLPFMSRSLPNLSTIVLVEATEDTLLQDAAEEAMAFQYNREIEKYFEDARSRSAEIRKL